MTVNLHYRVKHLATAQNKNKVEIIPISTLGKKSNFLRSP
ncbi:hypothetical protein CULT_1510011 [[Clostridium] ultunense Esp]|nr:hypothetical protein CULT_1510011 [[Clostridium] ultunense Esp]